MTDHYAIDERHNSYQIVRDVPEPQRGSEKNWIATFPKTEFGRLNAEILLKVLEEGAYYPPRCPK